MMGTRSMAVRQVHRLPFLASGSPPANTPEALWSPHAGVLAGPPGHEYQRWPDFPALYTVSFFYRCLHHVLYCSHPVSNVSSDSYPFTSGPFPNAFATWSHTESSIYFRALMLDLGHCVAIRTRIRSCSPNQPTVGVRSLLDDLPTAELTSRTPGQILDMVP